MIYDKEDEDQEIAILKLEKERAGKEFYGKKEENWRRIDLFRKFYRLSRKSNTRVRVQCFEPRLFEGDADGTDAGPAYQSLAEQLARENSIDSRNLEGVRGDIDKILSGLSSLNRCVFILKNLWEFTNDEIGYCFGVTESRISQRLKSIQETIYETLSQASDPKLSQETGSFEKSQSQTDAREKKECGFSRPRKSSVGTLFESKGAGLELQAHQGLASCQSFQMESFDAASF